MTGPALAAIVEGHSEVQSLGVLARRLHPGLRVARPVRVKRGRIVQAGELERAVRLAAAKIEGRGGVVVLLDADDDCPATLAPALLARCAVAAPGLDCRVVLPTRETEAWFLAGIESLVPGVAPPPDAERVRGAKEWLSRAIGRRYVEVTDQPAFAARLDLDLARGRSPSLDKFLRDLDALAVACAAAP